ncbi:SAM-dependent methyltransferase [Undibacterium sp. TJN19]|uniref:SAM-dependent methyltransferase n=1 Tax=Undibacterium sp. TJN19 TaxID=3413055 RepID=UPI003BF19735
MRRDLTVITSHWVHLTVIEENQRLSASRLWQWQRQFFSEQTIAAWRNSIVPHYVTSNTFIARAYARLVFGHLRDLLSDQHHALDAQQPVTVLELGAGSGRFSYHFLKKFFALLQQSTLSHLRVRYVMTDFSEKNLAFWKQHPFLQDYITRGLLDFALVDINLPQDIVLQVSGDVLSAAQMYNPLVVIANYVFDSIEQDCFYLHHGELHESLVSLHDIDNEDSTEPPADASILHRLDLRFTNRPASPDYYPEAELNNLLAYYASRKVDGYVLLPTQALRYLAHLRRLSNNRLLLISGDKGDSREEDVVLPTAPAIVSHGSISLMVNYHALALVVQQQGGVFMATPQQHHGLHICAAAFHPHADTGNTSDAFYPETRQAFREHISETSPDDFYLLKCFIQPNAVLLDLPQLLAYLRLSGWDAANFMGCYDALLQCAANLQEASLKQEIISMAAQVWDTYYPLGESTDIAQALGSLLYEIDAYAQAMIYLQHSRDLHGDDASIVYNMGMCHYNMGQLVPALSYVKQSLQLKPGYEPATLMQVVIEEELAKPVLV